MKTALRLLTLALAFQEAGPPRKPQVPKTEPDLFQFTTWPVYPRDFIAVEFTDQRYCEAYVSMGLTRKKIRDIFPDECGPQFISSDSTQRSIGDRP